MTTTTTQATKVITAIVFGLVSAPVLWTIPAQADSVSDFYSGKTITVVNSGGAGGSHGAYAQLITAHIDKFIPGNPNVINQYMPGAGGNKAMNYLYNATRDDGTYIGAPLQNLVFNARIGVKGVKYDASKAHYLGGADAPFVSVTVMKSSGIASLDDAKRKEVIMASAGRGGPAYMVPTLINFLLDTKFKVIGGYRGLGNMHLAMENGEVHGRAASWASIVGTKKAWITNNLVTNLITITMKREPALPNVPALGELVTTDEDRSVVRLLTASKALGRAWVAFGDIPKDRLAALREAYAKTLVDPAFLADAAKRGLPLQPVSWQDQQKLSMSIVAASDATVARLKKIVEHK